MKTTQYLFGSILALSVPFSSFAADVIANWTGGEAGTYLWSTPGNWSSGVPNNGSGNRYQAVVGDSIGSRVITTNGAVTVSRLLINQSTATSGAGTTLRLGGDFLINGNSISGFSPSAFTNSTGDASKLVIDLNGYNFSVESTLTFSNLDTASNFTIRSTGDAGGVFAVRRIISSASNVSVENNVTVQLTQLTAQYLAGYTFSKSSTLQLSSVGDYASFRVTNNPVGNLLIGNAVATGRTTATLQANLRTQGAVTLSAYSGATGGDASLLSLNGNTLFVGGAITDNGSNGDTYGSGAIVFTGNPVTAQAVKIGRQSLTNNFSVGENSSNRGNIELDANLTTTGTFVLLADSRLDTHTHLLRAGGVSVENGADVALTFGSETGGIIATGSLQLSGFHLELTYDGGGWTDGTNLLLFSYASTFTGNPILESLVGTGFTYDALVHDTVLKQVYLSNVAIVPEPCTVTLLGLGMFLLLKRVRRKNA